MELTVRAARRSIGLVLAAVGPLSWAGPAPTRDVEEARAATAMLIELASLPSQSSDIPAVGSAARWIEERMTQLGFQVRDLQAGAGGAPLLFARRDPAGPAGAASVLFYLHYDTQPPGPQSDWGSTRGQAFVPRLLTGRWDEPGVRDLDPAELDSSSMAGARLYGRGVADDKGPIVMHIRALSRWLEQGAAAGRLSIRFLFDGEEEAGSRQLPDALRRNQELLAADLLVLCDGPMDPLGRPSVYLGTRGDMHVRLRLRTSALAAHSGNYGLLPNAAFRMASLLSSMKDDRGEPLVEGLEEGAARPTRQERETLAIASLAEPVIAKHLGVGRFDGDPEVPYYERLLFRPSLIVNHLSSGRPGNQIPNVAEAILEVRLVAGQEPRRIHESIRRHVLRLEPTAELEYLDGVPAGRMSLEDPAVARAVEAIRSAAGGDLLVYPSLGGTLPLLHDFASAGHRYVGLPLVNYDNSQHVGNENLLVERLPEGAALLARLYERLSRP